MTRAAAPAAKLLAGATACLAGACMLGCGGGTPLLHPVRTLPQGDVRAAAGFGTTVGTGAFARALDEAHGIAARSPELPGTPGRNAPYARGALVAASVAPGVAPLVGARVGVGSGFEGGLAYTGRGVRADARRSFDIESVKGLSVSAGIGGSAVFFGQAQGGALPAVDLGAVRGFGADVPLLIGWESDAGLYRVWAGARGGWEHATITARRSEPKLNSLGAPPTRLEADRFWAGGVVGLAVGFRHVHVAMELDVAWQTLRGTWNATRATASGITLGPATALWLRF